MSSTGGLISAVAAPPRVGDHVLYVRGRPGEVAIPQHALVHIVFSDLGSRPALTLVTVKPGEGGICYRSSVPHRSRWVDERGYYILPEEVWP